MTIKVEVKNVYGNQAIYPACDKAKTFAALIGQKTFTAKDIRYIKALGYQIEQVAKQVTL